MVVNIMDFIHTKTTTSTGVQTLTLTRAPLGRTGVTNGALQAEFTICYSRNTVTSAVGIAKFIAGWYFSGSDTLHSTRFEIARIGNTGAGFPATNIGVVTNNPVIMVTPLSAASTKWVFRGAIWVSAA